MFELFLVLLVLVGIAVPLASYWLSERFARQLRALSGSMDEVGRLELADTPFLPTKVREIVAMQQALAGMTRLLVSEETASRLNGEVLARALDVVAVKGKVRGVKVYQLLATRTGKPAIDADNLWLCDISRAALDDYLARDFGKAAAAWERILEVHPADGAAAAMKARAEIFVRAPPPPDWTGVHIAKEK